MAEREELLTVLNKFSDGGYFSRNRFRDILIKLDPSVEAERLVSALDPQGTDRLSCRHIVDVLFAPPSSQWEFAFFDLDDCLYKNDWATEQKITAKMNEYLTKVLNLPQGSSDRLYKTYGTTIAGLIEEKHLAEADVQAFLDYGHDIDLSEDIKPDPQLRALLEKIPCRRWVFSNSARGHVERCLDILGIRDLFEGIVAASSVEMFARCGYVTKPHPKCFQATMEVAGVTDPRKCIFFDDSVKNVKAAKQVGWNAVLVGLTDRKGETLQCPEADASISTIHDMPLGLPGLVDGSLVGA